MAWETQCVAGLFRPLKFAALHLIGAVAGDGAMGVASPVFHRQFVRVPALWGSEHIPPVCEGRLCANF